MNSGYRRFLILAAVILGLTAGCTPQGNLRSSASDTPAIIEAKAELVKRPDNPAAVGTLADAYAQAFGQSGHRSHRTEAISRYREYLEMVPNNFGAAAALYVLLGTTLSEFGSQSALTEMESIWNGHDILHNGSLPPPDTYRAAQMLGNFNPNEEMAEFRRLLRSAIKQSPKHNGARVLLAKSYAYEQRFELAKATLAQAKSLEPDNGRVLTQLAEISLDQVDAEFCKSDFDRALLDDAIAAAKAAVAKSPQDPDPQLILSRLLFIDGRFQLSVFSVRRAEALESHAGHRISLSHMLYLAGNSAEAEKHLTPLLNDDEWGPLANEVMAHLNLSRQRWHEAARNFENLQNSPLGRDFYNRLWQAMTMQRMGQADEARDLLQSFPKRWIDNEWQRTLLRFQLGQIDDHALLAAADDRCKQTEAHFALGFRSWIDGDLSAAAESLQATRILGVNKYHEHFLAGQLLPLIEKDLSGHASSASTRDAPPG